MHFWAKPFKMLSAEKMSDSLVLKLISNINNNHYSYNINMVERIERGVPSFAQSTFVLFYILFGFF